MQYGHKGPEARESCRLFIGTSDCRSFEREKRILLATQRFRYCHQCGDHTALLSEGRTPPSVMPIDSPRESASGGNENSTGDSLVRRLEGLPWGRRRRPKRPLAHDSRILLALACLPFLPAAPTPRASLPTFPDKTAATTTTNNRPTTIHRAGASSLSLFPMNVVVVLGAAFLGCCCLWVVGRDTEGVFPFVGSRQLWLFGELTTWLTVG